MRAIMEQINRMTDYSARMAIRIDWSEIDLFGHVNNLAILKYIQAARVSFLETIGLMQMQAEEKNGPILGSVNCRFRKPLFYPGEAIIYSRPGLVKNTSFIIEHVLFNDRDELAAEAEDVIVFYDFERQVKQPLLQELRDRIESLKAAKV